MTPFPRLSLRRCHAVLAAVLMLAACGDATPPEARPDDLAVTYSWDLAPADVTGRLDIVKGRATYRDTRGANQVRFTFQPAPAQLDALWRAFRENRVDTISTEEKAAGRRKSVETLIVRWSDREITLSDGVKVRVRADDQERWRKIQLALRTLILAERRKRGLPEN